MKKIKWFYPVLLVLVPIVFHRAFFSQYVLWDDDVLLLQNPILKAPFWEALKTSFTVYYHGDYFPLTLMSYWIDIAALGMGPGLQHAENLALHLLATFLLLSCLRKLAQNDALAFLLTLIYAIHPLQAEAVMWISERKSLLSAVFTFLALLSYLKSFEGPRKKTWYWLGIFCFGAAGLAKATSLLMPLIFLLIDSFKFGRPYRALALRFLPAAGLAGLLMALRIRAYASTVGLAISDVFTGEYLLSIPVRTFNALGIYVKMFFLPTTLSAIYPDFELTALSIAVATITALAVVVISWRIYRARNLFLSFSWLWFLLFLLPILQIFPRINYINERYMYLPIIGLGGISFYYFRPRILYVLAAVLGILMAVTTYHYSDVWTTNRKLWSQTLNVVPQNMIALNNLALDFQNAGELPAAVELYEKIIDLPTSDNMNNRYLEQVR